MKITLRSLALLLLVTAGLRAEPETVETAEAQRIAHRLHGLLGSPADAPFTADIDADRPHGIKASGLGLLALPDRKLTADAIGNAGKEVAPLGQLWTLVATLASGGRPLSSDKLRLVRFDEGEKSHEVQVYYLGAAKNDAGELQLVVFAKDKTEPVLRTALTKTGGTSQSSPIELSGRKQDENTGLLTLRFLGEYSAELPVMKPE